MVRPRDLAAVGLCSRIAIVSAIGPDLILGQTGPALADDQSQSIAVPQWDLDGVALTAARTALARRFQVVAATRIDPNETPLLSTATILDAARKGALAPTPADLILVISLSNSALNRQGHPSVDYGVGVSRWRALPVFGQPPYVHAFLAVTLIDGKSLTVVAQAAMKMKAREPSVFGEDETLPFVPLQNFDWHDHWPDLTSKQHDQIHQLLATLLKQSVPFTLDKLPPP
jgi:hypothetical protein